LNDLCRQNGSRFFLLIPPTRDVNDASNELQAAAAKEGLLVVLPFQHAELPENAFLDGSHLNPKGAALFTERWGRRCFNRFTGTDARRARAFLAPISFRASSALA